MNLGVSFVEENRHKPPNWLLTAILILITIILFLICIRKYCWAENPPATILIASWYSIDSLKKEGTWKNGVERRMANGKIFDETKFTCATNLYPLGTILRVFYIRGTIVRSVVVTVTDRIGKRFAKKRIDLSKGAFMQIANLKQGIISVKVEVINGK